MRLPTVFSSSCRARSAVYQDLALADNLDVVANLFLGHEQLSSGPARATWQINENAMEHRSHELLARHNLLKLHTHTPAADSA